MGKGANVEMRTEVDMVCIDGNGGQRRMDVEDDPEHDELSEPDAAHRRARDKHTQTSRILLKYSHLTLSTVKLLRCSYILRLSSSSSGLTRRPCPRPCPRYPAVVTHAELHPWSTT